MTTPEYKYQEGAADRFIKSQVQPFKIWKVSDFVRANGAELVKIAIVLPTPVIDDDIIAKAAGHRMKFAKQRGGDGWESAFNDQRLHVQTEAIEALWYVCRNVVNEGGVEKPSNFAAFMSPDWMRQNLRYEQWMALYNLYLATCAEFSKAPRISAEVMAALRPFLAENDSVDARLSGYERQDIVNMAAHFAWQADKETKACEAALKERDDAEAKLEDALRRIAELEAELAAAKPTTD